MSTNQIGMYVDKTLQPSSVEDSFRMLGGFPPYTTTNRDLIQAPYKGMIIYNTTTNKLNVYTTAWEAITSA